MYAYERLRKNSEWTWRINLETIDEIIAVEIEEGDGKRENQDGHIWDCLEHEKLERKGLETKITRPLKRYEAL